MTQGIWINHRRPKSKKEIKEAVQNDPNSVFIEGTSIHAGEYGGDVMGMPENKVIYFVGPDPYTKRNFYGQIVRVGEKVTVR